MPGMQRTQSYKTPPEVFLVIVLGALFIAFINHHSNIAQLRILQPPIMTQQGGIIINATPSSQQRMDDLTYSFNNTVRTGHGTESNSSAIVQLPPCSGPTFTNVSIYPGTNDAVQLSLSPSSSHRTRKVYDVFMFDHEFALLEVRLQELWDVVDHFVLIEAPFSQAGRPKPLYFKENKDRYTKYMSKILHVMPESNTHLHENSQRGLAMKVLQDLSKDTMIILSDLDEIPRCSVVDTLGRTQNIPTDFYVMLDLGFFYYSLRWEYEAQSYAERLHASNTAKVFLRSFLDTTKIQDIAFAHHNMQRPRWVVQDAGFHCSYCMSPEDISLKIKNFAHQVMMHQGCYLLCPCVTLMRVCWRTGIQPGAVHSQGPHNRPHGQGNRLV